MTQKEKTVFNLGIICALFCLLVSMLVPMFEPAQAYDVAFADVGDTFLLSATVEPADAYQGVEWTLAWDEEKTSSITYAVIKNKDPYDYIGLDIDGLNCTLTVIKYHKVVIKYTVYLILTCTSTWDSSKSATCSIKLG